MNKIILPIVFLLMLAGCAQEQTPTQKNDTVAPAQETKQIEPIRSLPSQKPDEIMAENSWGFSVYDPKTGIEKFYTSDCALLGSKNR